MRQWVRYLSYRDLVVIVEAKAVLLFHTTQAEVALAVPPVGMAHQTAEVRVRPEVEVVTTEASRPRRHRVYPLTLRYFRSCGNMWLPPLPFRRI